MNIRLQLRWIITCACLLTVVLAYLFPMMTDEAYYIAWARDLDWPRLGFFDHPPFVSYQAVLTRLWNDVGVARVGCLIAAAGTLSMVLLLTVLHTRSKANGLFAVALLATTLGGIGNAILLTPDSGLMLFWSWALLEGYLAVAGMPKRWLWAGVATGCGLMAKYTMVLMGPIFLLGLLIGAREQLKSKWPYLGGCIALSIFSLNLFWNASYGYPTLKFQLRHGFSMEKNVTQSQILPLATTAEPADSTALLLAELERKLAGIEGFNDGKTKAKKKPSSRLETGWQYVGDFWGGVAGLWGLYSFLGLWFLWSRGRSYFREVQKRWDPKELYLWCAVLWPVGFFGCLSPFSKVEANWPAMHMIALTVLIASSLDGDGLRKFPVRFIGGVHFVLLFILIYSLSIASQLPNLRNNRMVVETVGYERMIAFLQENIHGSHLAVDSYQLKSALDARNAPWEVVQWPGVSRPSDFTLLHESTIKSQQSFLQYIEKHHTFDMLVAEEFPAEIPGFKAIALRGLRACPTGELGLYGVDHPHLPCEKGVKDWWLVTYLRL
jgi:4-amino-4-deoxy-L-arabinose transferase-like glycosyltransferase